MPIKPPLQYLRRHSGRHNNNNNNKKQIRRMNKNFLYGIGRFTFKGKELGYIEKGSFDFGGKEPESVDVEAEQVPDAPVLSLAQKNGTIEPTST